jgi:hypothetical protein
MLFSCSCTDAIKEWTQQTPLLKTEHVLCVLAHYLYVAGTWVVAHLGSLKDFFTILGIAVGGYWTYLNYIRGRINKHRLEPTVSGQFLETETASYLLIRVSVKNVGLTRVPLRKDFANLLVYPASRSAASPTCVELINWPDIKTLDRIPVLTEYHAWIEPAEPIQEEIALRIPTPPADAYQILLRISNKDAWTANAVVLTKIKQVTVSTAQQGAHTL